MLAWLSRGKLWDDVFTRAVAALITAAVLSIFALAAGLIHFDGRAWGVFGVVVAGVFLGAAAGLRQYRSVLESDGEETSGGKYRAIQRRRDYSPLRPVG
jgi:hypothetical protein